MLISLIHTYFHTLNWSGGGSLPNAEETIILYVSVLRELEITCNIGMLQFHFALNLCLCTLNIIHDEWKPIETNYYWITIKSFA